MQFEVTTTYILGFVNAMDVRKLDNFPLYGLKLSLTGTSLHETRILKENGQNNKNDWRHIIQ